MEVKKILLKNNISTFVGVPCSIFKNLLKDLESDKSFEVIYTPREENAAAIQGGMWLKNKKSIVFSQNSGLGNMVNFITSFIHIYDSPFLAFISLRGKFNENDAPQHIFMGRITLDLLQCLNIEFSIPKTKKELARMLNKDLDNFFERHRKQVYIIQKGLFK